MINQIDNFAFNLDQSLSDTNNFSYLTRALEYREQLYKLISDLLNPQSSNLLARDLQKKLAAIRSDKTIISLYHAKQRKKDIFANLIDDIFASPSSFAIDFKNSASLGDKLWTKALLIDDLVYYGPVTILSIAAILDRAEDLSLNPVYQLLRENVEYPQITEIRVNSASDIYYEAVNKIFKWPIPFLSEDHLESIIQRMISEVNIVNNASIKINASSPIADFEHPCGYIRGSAVLPPACESPFLTLRIHPGRPYKLDDLQNFAMFDEEIKTFFQAIQEAGTTIAIAGTMGSGKTTLLSALAEHWPAKGRKATIEDTPELRPEISDLIKMRTIEYDRDDLNDIDVTRLTKACKRHSVRYVVLSEARDGSAWEILQLSQAILGCLMTYHYTLRSNENMVDQALNTLVALCKQHPLAADGEDIKYLIASMVQILILVEQSPFDDIRRVIKIYYITGFDKLNGGNFKYTELFSFDQDRGFHKVNISSEFQDYLHSKGVNYSF